eukprot:7768822-Pyramimonas_sp.AAC.1
MAVDDNSYEGSAHAWAGGAGSSDMFDEQMFVVAFARDCSALDPSLAHGCYQAKSSTERTKK